MTVAGSICRLAFFVVSLYVRNGFLKYYTASLLK